MNLRGPTPQKIDLPSRICYSNVNEYLKIFRETPQWRLCFSAEIYTILQDNARGRKAMPKKTKANLEFLLVKAEVKGGVCAEP